MQCKIDNLRASTSVCLNFLSILHEKAYFFYFTHPLLQNTHISLSILHIYSIKYSLFYNFLLFTPSLPLSLIDPQLPSPPSSSPTQSAVRSSKPTNVPEKPSQSRSKPTNPHPQSTKKLEKMDQNPPPCDGRRP